MHLQAFQTQVHCRLRTARQSFSLVPYAYAIVLPINPSRSAGKYWLAVVKWAHLVVCLASQEFAFRFREHLYVAIELLALTHAYPRFGVAGSTSSTRGRWCQRTHVYLLTAECLKQHLLEQNRVIREVFGHQIHARIIPVKRRILALKPCEDGCARDQIHPIASSVPERSAR